MEKSLSRQILLAVLGLALLIVAFVGVSYAIRVTAVNDSYSGLYDNNSVSISFINSENNIIECKALSISDERGKKLTDDNVFDFSVKSTLAPFTTLDYVVVAEKVESDIDLDYNNVKLYLEKLIDGNYVPASITDIPITFSSNRFGSRENSVSLEFASIQNISSKDKMFNDNYRLRVWLSDNTIIDDYDKNFQIKVSVFEKIL